MWSMQGPDIEASMISINRTQTHALSQYTRNHEKIEIGKFDIEAPE